MAHPQIATFARLAERNDKPIRKIEGQKTLLGRTMHSIMYDEIHDEFTLPQPFAQAILTFRGGANGEEAPIRVIQGPKTTIVAPDRLEVDPVNNEILVPEGNRILVFSRTANALVFPVVQDGVQFQMVAIEGFAQLVSSATMPADKGLTCTGDISALRGKEVVTVSGITLDTLAIPDQTGNLLLVE